MLNVVVVDDSVLMRNNIKSYVEELGHKVVGEAENGIVAVEMCSKLNPDIITMDITMPDMDGITAIKKIREFNTDVNIIISTSHGQENIIMQSLQAGAKGYILKPMNKDKLSDIIDNIYQTKSNDEEEYLLDDWFRWYRNKKFYM